ncbi:DnaJ domain-containing protein [bacterium]|nr:DnaJ domain-containing protein [bacterium]
MVRHSSHKVTALKKSDFLDFFAIMEKKAISANIVLVSGEVKSLFFLKQGRIIAHKSNVEREHHLNQLIENLDAEQRTFIQHGLDQLSPFDQWAYLYNKNLIKESAYQDFLEKDCSSIILAHYSSKETNALRVSNVEAEHQHMLSIAPFKIVFEALKQTIKIEAVNQYEQVNIKVKKKDVFDAYQKYVSHESIVYDKKKELFYVMHPQSELVLDLYLLKEYQVVDLEMFSEKIEQKYKITSEKDLLNKNAFEVFGLDETASGAIIKKKYMEMVATHHPDKNGNLPEKEKRTIEKIFSQITLAYKKISTAEQRKEYIKELSKIKESQKAQKKVKAETIFFEGLAQMKNKNFDGAYEKFNESNKILPDEKYRIYAAWSYFRLGVKNNSRATIEEARENLKKETLKDMPMLEALFYLASIEKNLGNYRQAKKYLSQVVDRDPYFMNAKVELNLINKRV